MNLTRIAEKIATSEIVSGPESDMFPVFVGFTIINWPDTNMEQAVASLKKLIESEGFKTGKFQMEQQEDNWAVGNLEVSEAFWDKYGEIGWESKDDLIEASMEV